MYRLFEYRCLKCGVNVERMVKSEVDIPTCPEDSTHEQMTKVISASTFHFANGDGTSMGKAWAFRGQPLRS
jgi:putative FmdB family regulatory protein